MVKRKPRLVGSSADKPPVANETSEEKYVPELSGNKYFKKILSKEGLTVTIDIYAFLRAYEVDDPAIAHAIKKLALPGGRGFKTVVDDLKEAIVAVQEAISYRTLQEAELSRDDPKRSST